MRIRVKDFLFQETTKAGCRLARCRDTLLSRLQRASLPLLLLQVGGSDNDNVSVSELSASDTSKGLSVPSPGRSAFRGLSTWLPHANSMSRSCKSSCPPFAAPRRRLRGTSSSMSRPEDDGISQQGTPSLSLRNSSHSESRLRIVYKFFNVATHAKGIFKTVLKLLRSPVFVCSIRGLPING